MSERPYYRNSFYDPKNPYSREFYIATTNPILYQGFEIHELSGTMYHIVKDSVCVGMYAGPNGAKKRVDELITV